jgi:hypothetical protein
MNRPMTVEATISNMSPTAAKMVAVEILLANPDSLHDDVLESCLYILRGRPVPCGGKYGTMRYA